MADIRTTPELDDFDRDEDPLSGGGNWAKVDTGVWPADMAATSAGDGAVGADPPDAFYYWTPGSHTGDMEVWATSSFGADLTEAWRLGLFKDVGIHGSVVDGYGILVTSDGGVADWSLRRYSNGGFTQIAGVLGGQHLSGGGDLALLRINGNEVEVFYSLDDGANWTMIMSATDTTYRTGLYLSLGISTDDGGNPGWINFGGGQEEDVIPQIWRKRRKHGSR